MLKAAITTAIVIALSTSAHAEQSIFGAVSDDTRVEIKAFSQGSFGGNAKHYTFAGGILSEGDLEGPRLSEEQIIKLNAYFEFVRQYGKSGRCTTTQIFQVDKYDGDDVISNERLVDETCISSARDFYEGHPGVTSPIQTPAEILYAFRHPEETAEPVRYVSPSSALAHIFEGMLKTPDHPE